MSGHSINLTQELAQVSSNIDIVQYAIVEQQGLMDSLINAEAPQESMNAARTYIAQLQASLGNLRRHESAIKEDITEEKQAGKNQNELAKG